MGMRVWLFCLFAGTFVLAFQSPLHAQKETGAITGKISADEEPLSGVIVTAASPSLIGGSRTTTTDRKGIYRFPSLPPGIYSLQAELSGFQQIGRASCRERV